MALHPLAGTSQVQNEAKRATQQDVDVIDFVTLGMFIIGEHAVIVYAEMLFRFWLTAKRPPR